MTQETAGPRTKGLRLDADVPVAVLRERLAAAAEARPGAGERVDGGLFSWPLLTLEDAALEHNVAAAAKVLAAGGVEHAPHVKTHMARPLWERQAAAGAWGATVATPAQLRTLRDWGVRRALLANELPDARDAAWLRGALAVDGFVEVWLEVDSPRGVAVLADAFAGAGPDVVGRLGVLVEVGLRGGRTGLRDVGDVVALARTARDAGLRVLGVAGYEGPAAAHADAAGLAAVAAWCDALAAAGERLRAEGLAGTGEPLVLSAGGSAFLDVVLDRLRPRPAGAPDATRVVVRSGAYVTHDHGHYAVTDPWSRIPGAAPLRPAITVWGQVLSAPEPGLVLLGVGRRDVSFDIDLPLPLWVRTPGPDGRLGEPRPLPGARVTALNDQHAFVALAGDGAAGLGDGGAGAVPAPGDVVGLGVSHPCTTLDKWRVAAVTRGDVVVDLYPIDL
ncbi:alanine racemase [Puerhibacterium sp. TATVAM-FAB25]|uniref:alanine racemase n=1 Tax=Puerhibacterium sp. TATVAM-FAB25 TaxID=3093699 RepID=UPI00397874EA